MTEIITRNDGLTVREAAARLGVSYQTIHNWIRDGRLPATWIGLRILRVKPEDVDALRREYSVTSVGSQPNRRRRL